MLDSTRTFKQFLFLIAEASNYNFNDASREQIRRATFLSATANGKYLNSFFRVDDKFQNDPTLDDYLRICKLLEALQWRIPKHLLLDSHGDTPCARIFRKGEPIYRCLTCGFDEACALCLECYHPLLHKNHKVNVTICQRENGGVCDCGDPEAWINEFTCSRSLTPPYLVVLTGELQHEFAQSLLETFQALLDFVIDVMAHSDAQFDSLDEVSQTKIITSTANSSFDPHAYCVDSHEDIVPPKYSLLVHNDQVHQYRDAVLRIRLASKKVEQFAEMVADRVQLFGRAKVVTSANISLLLERQRILAGTGLATCIRNNRDIFREDMCDELLLWLRDVTESELFKHNVNLKNLYCLAFCGRWNVGLKAGLWEKEWNSSANGETSDESPRTSKKMTTKYQTGKLDGLRIPKIPTTATDHKSHWFFKPLKWDLSDEMAKRCEYNLTEEDYDVHSSHWGSRLQYLIYLDIRFWKSIRVMLHDMYLTSLIINLDYKVVIAYQYVDIYPTIADMFLTMDREPELNIMCTLSTQLFTCPSNSARILQHGDVARIFALIYCFLTVGEVRSPENVEVTNEVSISRLKNRRWSQIFFDIGYILSRSSDPHTILTTNIIPMVCDILALFQGKPVMKRERNTHVEYESPDYTAFFLSIVVIYQFAEYVAQSLGSIAPPFKRSLASNAISYVVRFLYRLEENDYPGLVDELIDINLSPTKQISKELIGGNIVQHFRIDEEKVSFLHPLHSFLCSLIELGGFESVDEIKQVLEIVSLTNRRPEIPNPLTTIFDYPLRTMVLMSQIKSGFWVRNGHSVRYQLQFYRSTFLRESGYMKDLYAAQLFIALTNPNLVCFLIFSRWLFLDGWIVKCDDEKNAKSHDIVEVENSDIQGSSSQGTSQQHEQDFANSHHSHEHNGNGNFHSHHHTNGNHDNFHGHVHETHLPNAQNDGTQLPNPHNDPHQRVNIVNPEQLVFNIRASTPRIDSPAPSGNFNSAVPYDAKTLPYMLEECLNFFIHVLTETIMLQSLDVDTMKETRIRNEIIHSLCFGPMNYTRMCAQIPDHVLMEKKFDLVLATVALREGMIYTLKEKYLKDVNPYYFSHSTNTKDDAIKFLKERIHKLTGKPISDIVIEPKIQDPASLGIYRYIGNFSALSYFSDFLIRTLRYILSEGADKAESLLDTALHLMHICSLEQNVDIEQYGLFYDRFVNICDNFGTSIAHVLYDILILDEFKGFHCKIRAIFKVFEERYHSLGQILSDQVPDFNHAVVDLGINNDTDEMELKKQRALDRKKKLMAKFKKQQSLFLKNNGIDNIETDTDMDVDTDLDDEHSKGWLFPEPHCILCQNAAENAGPFGIITYLSRSSESRTVPFDDPYWFMHAFLDGPNLTGDRLDPFNSECDAHKTANWYAFEKSVKDNHVVGPGFSHQGLSRLISNSCAHGMHFQCYVNFLNNNRSKLTQITRNYPENAEHKEFLCPLCKAINNVFIPVLWSTNDRSLADFIRPGTGITGMGAFMKLNKALLADQDWYMNFTAAVDRDISKDSLLNAASLEMLNEKSVDYKPLRLLLNNVSQIASVLSFPQVFSPESPLILTNTVKSIEVYLRGTSTGDGLVLNQLSSNSLINLRTLNEFRNFGVFISVKTPSLRDDAFARMIANLFAFAPDQINSTILEADMFEMLVKIVPLKSADIPFYDILRICWICHIIQAMAIFAQEFRRNGFLSSDLVSILDVPAIPGIPNEMGDTMNSVFGRFFEGVSGYLNDPTFGKIVFTMLVKTTTVFLRRAAIYSYVQCASLKSIDIDAYDQKLEADRLCAFLDLPNMSDILTGFANPNGAFPHEYGIFNSFIHSMPSWEFETSKFMEYPGIIRLIDLPLTLDQFFSDYYYSERSGNPHLTIEDPAVCLFCAEVVDAQKAALGSKYGQCTTHYMKECPNDVGIFLLPKDRTLLLLHKNGGTFYNAPYLDPHGELYTEAKKTKTMTLDVKKYDDFMRNIWLLHNVVNIIVRNLDSAMDPGGWETM